MLASTSGGALFPLVARVLFPFDDFYLVDDLFSVFLKTKRRRQQRCHRHHHAALVSNPIPRRSPPGRRPKFYNSWRRVTEKSTVSSSRRRPAVVLSLSLSLSLWRVRPRNVCVHKRWLTLLFFSLQSIQRRRQRHQRPTTPALLLLPGGSCPSDEVIKMQQRRITKTLKSEDNKL